MKPEVVTRRIEAFHQRFGEAHLDFAYHAAFPLALTPDLLYRLWANFQRDRNGEALKIPWLVVADLLLSSLCDEVGYELYEMETEVRNALLRELKANPRFGEKRIHELSDFLLVYVKQQLESHDPDIRDFAQVQTWTALAYTKPGEAARQIASTLRDLKFEEKAEWVRMASVVETFAEPLAGFEPLLIYSRAISNFVRGKTTKAATELSQLAKAGDKLKVSGLNFSIPESLIRQIEENSESTQDFGDRLGFDSVPEEPVQVQSPPIKKILILAANPKDTSRLRVDQELRDIKEGLQRSQSRDQFSFKQQLAVRPRDIRRALLDFDPQIIHFCGHGTEERLIFEDDSGKSKLVSGDTLAGLFQLFADRIECVVLNGCYSEVQAQAIARHVNYVIGMSQEIGDKAAIKFAVGFYDALGAGRSIEFAYKLGCSAMRMQGIDEHLTPVLLRKPQIAGSVAQKILTLEPPPVQPESLSQPENRAIEVFFSYAHKDEKLRDELAKHLKLLERQGVIKAWYDRDISAGNEWKSEIEKQLNSAQIILLLVSSDFLASDFCWSVELERVMQRHEAQEARVIPIILREVDWHQAPFGKLQALPKNAEPVTNWANRDQAFTDIARGISRVVKELARNY